jgi:ERCC4-type nuclease
MAPVAPTKSKLIIRRNGKSTTTLVPRPVVLIDTREQLPYSFDAYGNWIGGTALTTLNTGDYSIQGMQDLIALERKTLNDVVRSLMADRGRFLRMIDRMGSFKYKCLLIEASRQEVKSPYQFADAVKAHPNGVVGSLDAIAARYSIQIHYGSDRALSEEFAASWLSKCHAYEWLESNGYGRVLQEGDL